MTARLVAAFILGALCAGVPLALFTPVEDHSSRYGTSEECAVAVDAGIAGAVEACMKRIKANRVWSDQSYCRLREAEEALQRHDPGWRGFFAERDRRRYDAKIDCSGPDMAPVEWTMEELASNVELGVR
jgi:hypothetical protein